MEPGYYWMKETDEPWRVVEIDGDEMYFTGSDVGAYRVENGPWKYAIQSAELKIQHLVKIEPPNP